MMRTPTTMLQQEDTLVVAAFALRRASAVSRHLEQQRKVAIRPLEVTQAVVTFIEAS